jgi:hypothetical protein
MKLLGFERRWMLLVFDTIYAGGDPTLPWKASEVPTTAAFIDDMFRVGPFWTVLGMRAALWGIILLAPLLGIGLPLPFSWIGDARRLRTLENLAASNIYVVREMPTLFKMLGAMSYCSFADVQRRVGIERPDYRLPSWAGEATRHG